MSPRYGLWQAEWKKYPVILDLDTERILFNKHRFAITVKALLIIT